MSDQPKIPVIKIRWCRQCGEKLEALCGPCANDSTREPHIVEVYELPPILETAKCGCCIRIECQLDKDLRPATCKKTMWRPISIAQRRKNQYCSNGLGSCSAIAQGIAKKKALTVECGNESCEWGPGKTRKKIERFAYRIKNFKRSYCCRSCQFIQIRREEKIAKLERHRIRMEVEEGHGPQMLSCAGYHRGEVTEHARLPSGRYRCVEAVGRGNAIAPCGAERDGSVDMAEAMRGSSINARPKLSAA